MITASGSHQRKKVRESKPKTKTFTGCWTCRGRKIKCDAVRPDCGQCRKSKLTCAGYDLKLYWITNEDVVAPSAIKRQAMTLEHLPSWNFNLDEIDQQLADLDLRNGELPNHVSVPTGPFTVFQVHQEHAVLPQLDLDALDAGGSSTLLATETINARMQYDEAIVLPRFGASSLEDRPQQQTLTHLAEFNTSSYQDPLVGRLMQHYIENVARLLQAIPHPQNPYSSIHAPKALSGSVRLSLMVDLQNTDLNSSPGSNSDADSSLSNVAIFYALMATSAFHLRQTDKSQDLGYLAQRFRAKAYWFLQKALEDLFRTDSDASVIELGAIRSIGLGVGDECEAAVSAMLTLITADIMEGSMSEYWIHLEGLAQLRKQWRRWEQRAIAPDTVERLICIGSFLTTIATTTATELPLLPWMGSLDMEYPLDTTSAASLGLKFSHGVTPRLVNMMQEIALLSQHVSFYQVCSQALPRSLILACEDLLDDLSAWSLESEPTSPDFDIHEITASLAAEHALAFYWALKVFFHTRIFPCTPLQMNNYISETANHLMQLERIKANAGFDVKASTSISWPGFIASCEAPADQRAIWYEWWEGTVASGIGNIADLWKVVQQSWALRDEGSVEVPAWMPVLKRQQRRILAV